MRLTQGLWRSSEQREIVVVGWAELFHCCGSLYLAHPLVMNTFSFYPQDRAFSQCCLSNDFRKSRFNPLPPAPALELFRRVLTLPVVQKFRLPLLGTNGRQAIFDSGCPCPDLKRQLSSEQERDCCVYSSSSSFLFSSQASDTAGFVEKAGRKRGASTLP